MKASESLKMIKEMTDEELLKEERDLKSELFKLRFQLATNQLDDAMKIKKVKRNIARVKTIIREREMKINVESK